MVFEGTERPVIRFIEKGHLAHLQEIAEALAMMEPNSLEELASRRGYSPIEGHRVENLRVREVDIYTGTVGGNTKEPDFRVIYRTLGDDAPLCSIDLTYEEAERALKLAPKNPAT